MHIHSLKRHLRVAVFVFDEVQGHHHHTGNPEENDVKTGDQYAGWVEGFERLAIVVKAGFALPIQRAKRP